MKHVNQFFSTFSFEAEPLCSNSDCSQNPWGIARYLSRRHREVRGRRPRAGKRSFEREQLESLGERCKLPRQGLGPSPDRFGCTKSPENASSGHKCHSVPVSRFDWSSQTILAENGCDQWTWGIFTGSSIDYINFSSLCTVPYHNQNCNTAK